MGKGGTLIESRFGAVRDDLAEADRYRRTAASDKRIELSGQPRVLDRANAVDPKAPSSRRWLHPHTRHSAVENGCSSVRDGLE